MGLIDKLIENLSPRLALKRELSRQRLSYIKERLYDAAKSSNYHVKPTDNRSGDGVMDHARDSIRNLARHLDENHDLAIGILDSLVNNTVGPNGITVEPQIKTKGGKLNEKANKEMRRAWLDWTKKAEVTQQLPWGEVQRLACRSWFRDGEILVQHVLGRGSYNHPGAVPYALELIEGDYLPFNLNQPEGPRIVHGVELNTWRQPLGYHVYMEHPNDRITFTSLYTKTKRIAAENVTHLKFVRRINQVRGVSILHGVINRLDDVKDYEESERIAARVAAAFTGYIRKAPEMAGAADIATGDRTMTMEAGMIFDNLLPGEEVGTIDSNRPNTGLESFRDGQLRAVAAGTGLSYSSISKNYNGTYSSQRQELVESQPSYERLRNYFINTFIDSVYDNFVTMAMASGALNLPRNIDPATLLEYEARGQGMTWIDPKKEIEADQLAVEARFKSRNQVIRDRGGDPSVVNEQIQLEIEYDKQHGFGVSVTEQPDEAAQGTAAESGNPDGEQKDDEKSEAVA